MGLIARRMLLVNGTADPVNPYQGGVVRFYGFASSRGTVLSSKASAWSFAERNGITAAPGRGSVTSGTTRRPHLDRKPHLVRRPQGGLPPLHGPRRWHVILQRAFRFPRLWVSARLSASSRARFCRREGIAESMYYSWSKEFLEAGKRRLAGDTARAATTDEVKQLRREAQDLKEVVAEQALELRLLKKSVIGDGGDQT